MDNDKEEERQLEDICGHLQCAYPSSMSLSEIAVAAKLHESRVRYLLEIACDEQGDNATVHDDGVGHYRYLPYGFYDCRPEPVTPKERQDEECRIPYMLADELYSLLKTNYEAPEEVMATAKRLVELLERDDAGLKRRKTTDEEF